MIVLRIWETSGGGIGCYMNNKFDFELIPNSFTCNRNVESFWIKLTSPKAKLPILISYIDHLMGQSLVL